MIAASIRRLAPIASLLFLLSPLAPAHAADPAGVMWETTSQMTMPGMSMQVPAQTQRVCSPRIKLAGKKMGTCDNPQ
jgi:hypothetical protein